MFGLSLKQKERNIGKCLVFYDHLYSYTHGTRHPSELCACRVQRNQIVHSYTGKMKCIVLLKPIKEYSVGIEGKSKTKLKKNREK